MKSSCKVSLKPRNKLLRAQTVIFRMLRRAAFAPRSLVATYSRQAGAQAAHAEHNKEEGPFKFSRKVGRRLWVELGLIDGALCCSLGSEGLMKKRVGRSL